MTCPRYVADVGGTYLRLALSPQPGEIRDAAACPTPAADWKAFVRSLRALMDGQSLLPREAPLHMAIAGLVDPGGTVASANIPCLNNRNVAAELGAALGRPVWLANDAHCAALAEAGSGAGCGHRIVFAIVLGTGVGGALVIDGKLVHGRGGIGGEWGHGPVLPSAIPSADGNADIAIPRLPCGCGQSGCVDTLGSARGLERLFQHLNGRARDSRHILDGWTSGDPDCGRCVHTYLQLVSGPLALAVNLTGASIVPVSGGLGASRALVAALDAAVKSAILQPPSGALVQPASHAGYGGLIGASFLVPDR